MKKGWRRDEGEWKVVEILEGRGRREGKERVTKPNLSKGLKDRLEPRALSKGV